MNTKTIILKSDNRGRVRTPPERRAALLAEFERSGLPATRFAALAGVRYPTFAAWIQQQRKRRADAAPSTAPKPARFAEVVPVAAVVSESPARVLRVRLSGGAVIELSDAVQVPLAARLIQALA